MRMPFVLSETDYRRHQLVSISQEAWQNLVDMRDDLKDPVIANWAARERPLIIRRACPQEPAGVPLGLPLPPSMGKRRISVVINETCILSSRPPPSLAEVLSDAPHQWREALTFLQSKAIENKWDIRVFGSLAWQWLTGLPYLNATSDLDVLLTCHSRTDALAQADLLAELEAMAPIPIDGELVLPDGDAVNWREIHLGQEELLMKSMTAARLVTRSCFLQALPS